MASHVVQGVAPVALGLQVAQVQLLAQAQLDPGGVVGDLAGDELDAAARRLVVEEDARDPENVVAFPVVDRDPMAVDLGHAVGAAGMEGGQLGLGDLLDLAEHLRGGGLVEADARVDGADGLQHARDADGGELGGQHRLVPGGGHEAHGGQVVHFVGLDLLDDLADGILVEQVGLADMDAVLDVLDAVEFFHAGTADHAVDLVALLQQEIGEIGTVLPGDAGDQRFFGHNRSSLSVHCSRIGAGRQPVHERP